MGDFYHEDGYYVSEKVYFHRDNLKYSHTVFTAHKLVDGEVESWNISPYEFIDKAMHMDEICDLIEESRC